MLEHISLDFLNVNSLRAFPIRETCSRKSTQGEFTIPDSLIVDFLLVGESEITASYFISRIAVNASQVTIDISRSFNSTIAVVGSVYISRLNSVNNRTFSMTPGAGWDGLRARMTIGTLSDLENEGTYGEFTLETAEFEMRTIVPNAYDATALVFTKADAAHTSRSVTGNVYLDFRHNLKFSKETNNASVSLNAGENLGLNATCATSQCIESINGIRPVSTTLADGTTAWNIKLQAPSTESCMKFLTSGNGTINISNTCCPPCMGCDSLAQIMERAISVETSMLQLKDMYLKLNVFVQNMAVNLNKTCPDCKSA